MSNSQLYIPKKCKVGFNIREDTYTGKLGYVILFDGKVWRKEKSWEGWRQKEGQKTSRWDRELGQHVPDIITGVEPIEFENVPTAGFVLNKKAGDTSSGWNHRQTVCRVYDPRGWEFEISIPNLLFILEESNSFKGKGLEGEFVYSWDGKDLVLLPTSSPNYTLSGQFTKLQNSKVKASELVDGCVYLTSKQEKMIYLGRHMIADGYYNMTDVEIEERNLTYKEYYGRDNHRSEYKKNTLKKQYVFANFIYNYKDRKNKSFTFTSGLDRFKEKLTDTPHKDFAYFMDELQKSKYYSLGTHLVVEPMDEDDERQLDYGCQMYKIVELKTAKDIQDARITCIRKRIYKDGQGYVYESDLYEIKTHEKNWSRYRTVEIIPETISKEELKEKYGKLYRVYGNGFKEKV